DAEERLVRRDGLERRGPGGDEDERALARALARNERLAEDRVVGNRRRPDAHEVDRPLVEARAPARTELEHLATRRHACPWQAARAEPDERGEPVDGGELRQLPGDAELAEERAPHRRLRNQGAELLLHLRVGTCV